MQIDVTFICSYPLPDRPVGGTSILLDVFTFGPAFQIEPGGGRAVGQITKHIATETRLDFDSPLQVQLFGPRLGRFVPFLQDLGNCSFVDFDELLQFVQVIVELLEAFDQRGKTGRELGTGRDTGLDDAFLVEQGLEPQGKLGLLLQVEGVDFFNLPFLAPVSKRKD